MDKDCSKIQFVEPPCGQHGSYTFYKAFKYFREGKPRILCLGEFFFLQMSKSAPMCIGELQLLWSERNTEVQLSSLKLYFLPQDTPQGQLSTHGQDEILAVSEKVVLKIEDLLSWVVDDYVQWDIGTKIVSHCDTQSDCSIENLKASFTVNNNGLCEENQNERVTPFRNQHVTSANNPEISVMILTYSKYCRLRGILLRVEGLEDKWLRSALIQAIGGFTIKTPVAFVLFCRDTFEHEELEENELRCDHLAPRLKGRPRKKRLHKDSSTDVADSSSGSSEIPKSRPKGMRFKDKLKLQEQSDSKEKIFLNAIHTFMKERNTPISRIPCLGFKQIDLFFFYTYAQKLGGYEKITERRLWKHLYDQLGGNPTNTGAATCTRRHYERLLLPYELYMKGKEDDIPILWEQKQHRRSERKDKEEEWTPNVHRQFMSVAPKRKGSVTDLNVVHKEREWAERRRQREIHERMVSKQLENSRVPSLKIPSPVSVPNGSTTADNGNGHVPLNPLEGLAALSQRQNLLLQNPYAAMQMQLIQNQLMQSTSKATSPTAYNRPLLFPQGNGLATGRKRPQVYGPPDLDIEHLRANKAPKVEESKKSMVTGGFDVQKNACDDEEPQDLSMKSSKNKAEPELGNNPPKCITNNVTPIWKPGNNKLHGRGSISQGVLSNSGKTEERMENEDMISTMTEDVTNMAANQLPIHPAFMMRPPVPHMFPSGTVPPVHLQQLYQAQFQANAAHAEALKSIMGNDAHSRLPLFMQSIPMMPQTFQERPFL